MRKINYKIVRTLTPHCSVCGEKLSGNNSEILLYECSCGVWKWNIEKKEWYIEKKLKIN